MKKGKRFLTLGVVLLTALLVTGCDIEESNTRKDTKKTLNIGNELASKQPTPTDINYLLEILK